MIPSLILQAGIETYSLRLYFPLRIFIKMGFGLFVILDQINDFLVDVWVVKATHIESDLGEAPADEQLLLELN